MRKLLAVFFCIIVCKLNAQEFEAKVYVPDISVLYLNQIYITNLRTRKTVLADYEGRFKIPAQAGDPIRFSSVVTERRDITLTSQLLERNQPIIKLEVAYYDIQEVVLNGYKLTGNLKTDVSAMPKSKSIILAEKVGLPEPRKGISANPMLNFQNGGVGFNVQSLFDIISGEKRKQNRLETYEVMEKDIKNMHAFFGEEYFTKKKIPKNLIDNFLRFVYTSDLLAPSLRNNNYVPAEISIEKYLPVYLKRLKISQLEEVLK